MSGESTGPDARKQGGQKSSPSELPQAVLSANIVIDCPALHVRSAAYPFGDRVPRRVRMLRTVTPDFPERCALGDPFPVAIMGMELSVWTNSHGAVCAVFPDGMNLGLRPDEFTVIRWHDES